METKTIQIDRCKCMKPCIEKEARFHRFNWTISSCFTRVSTVAILSIARNYGRTLCNLQYISSVLI